MNEEFKRLYPDTDNSVLEVMFGVSNNTIRNHAKWLGIKKTKAYRSQQNKATQFHKGDAPFNKGVPRKEWCSPEGLAIVEATQFKKGQRSHNEYPLGTDIVRCDTGAVYTKVSMDAKTARQRWKPKHHVVWSERNGKIPPGCTVAFRDGDKLNFSPDNLELINKNELLRRNFNVPLEIRQLYGLKGALTRKINSTSKTKDNG